MKQIKNLLLVCALSVSTVAFSQTRVMTSKEKEKLLTNAEFKSRCEWAIRDYASYWSIHDGSGLSTEADRIKWAKDRLFGVAIVTNGITDPNVTLKFLTAAKGKQFSLPAGEQEVDTLLAAWNTANTYEEMTSEYFRYIGNTVDMSIGN